MNITTLVADVKTPYQQRLLAPSETAALIDVTEGTLAVWRSTGRYALPFVKIGNKVRYRLEDVQAWLESRTRTDGATA